jgi:Rrf2 family protein
MVDLAFNYKKGPVQLNTVAKGEKVSKKYLEQIIIRLMNANLVKSVRGPKGGYILTKSPERIKIIDIYNAVEEPLVLVKCLKNPKMCNLVKTCATRPYWQEVQESLKKILSNKNLKSLAEKKVKQ